MTIVPATSKHTRRFTQSSSGTIVDPSPIQIKAASVVRKQHETMVLGFRLWGLGFRLLGADGGGGGMIPRSGEFRNATTANLPPATTPLLSQEDTCIGTQVPCCKSQGLKRTTEPKSCFSATRWGHCHPAGREEVLSAGRIPKSKIQKSPEPTEELSHKGHTRPTIRKLPRQRQGIALKIIVVHWPFDRSC